MKKNFMLLISLSVAIVCRAQQVLHVANGGIISIELNTEVSLSGGITLENGSNLTNNGTIRLKNNPVANQSDWLDYSSSGALSGQGLVIFNSNNGQNFTGASTFYKLHIDAAGGLALNNNMIIDNALRLINGKINSSSNFVFLNNNNPASLENDAANQGYVNSWINGNFRRLVIANTSIYDFPVGNATRSNLLQFFNNNISGASYLTASFRTKPGTDAGLNVSENSIPYTSVNDGGVWYLTPGATPSSGNYALQLYFNGFTSLADNKFGILRRSDGSSDASDWLVPSGSALEINDGAGRKVSDGYSRRINLSDFSQFGIGMSGTSCVDVDKDGYTTCDGDCNDNDAEVNPAATEICNGIDDDCDGLTDDVDPTISGQGTWYADTDNDGFGDVASSMLACTQPAGYVANADDCNDAMGSIHPNAVETCNGIDDDCDGVIDDGATGQTTWYADSDNDGFGDIASSMLACTQPAGYVANADDCNDADNSIHPNAVETCNGIDDDCDGVIDDGATGQLTWYADADRDGYGNAAVTLLACTQPAGYVSNAGDCNDAKGQIHPGANEACNGIDDDCDGQIDEGCATVSINDVSAYESAGAINLTVSLSQTSNLPVKISYKTIDGTAVSGGRNKDFKSVGNETVTIPAGQKTATIAIEIYRDNLNEGNEYFDVQLTKVVNALTGDNTGRATILNGTGSSPGLKDPKTSAGEIFEVLAYPNPSINNFKIEIRSNDVKEKIVMQVYDQLGRLVEVRNNVSAGSLIPIGDLYRPGLYYIRVLKGSEHKEIKLVKLSD